MKTRSFPAHLLRLWLDPRVSRNKKLALPLVVAAYWLLPDLMPFLPVDDLLFTVLMTYWFTRSADKEVSGGINAKGSNSHKGTGTYVDVQAEVIDESED